MRRRVAWWLLVAVVRLVVVLVCIPIGLVLGVCGVVALSATVGRK